MRGPSTPMLDSIVKFFADYLRGRPITDVLLIVLIGQAIWVESMRKQTTDHAHDMVRSYLKDVRDESDKNADRLVSALTELRHGQRLVVEAQQRTTAEVAKIPEAAATAAAKIVDDKDGVK